MISSWCLVKILKMEFDQDMCLNLRYDFGKMNSAIGFVVPLAMFIIIESWLHHLEDMAKLDIIFNDVVWPKLPQEVKAAEVKAQVVKDKRLKMY